MSGDCKVLLVSSSDAPPSVRSCLSRLKARVRAAHSCFEARNLLSADRFELVITDTRLRDGNWYSVLRSLVDADCTGNLLVLDDHDDRDFRERVRSLGGYDLIDSHLDESRAQHVIEGACGLRSVATKAGRA